VNLDDHFLKDHAVVLLKKSPGGTALDMALHVIHPQFHLCLVPINDICNFILDVFIYQGPRGEFIY